MKDYIIFDHAPVITFTTTEVIDDWYANTKSATERTRIIGTISTSNCADNFALDNVECDIKIRGNYTANYSKKPFQIKFDKKQNLFGLNNGNKNKKWILLAEYNDSSMLRNALAFYMGQQLAKDDSSIWSPTFTFAHFYIKDAVTTYYMGLYLLCDQKEQAKTRVNVFEPEDGYEDTDIGYFFEKDDYFQTADDPIFVLGDEDYVPVPPTKTVHESNRWARQSSGATFTFDGYTIKSKITNEDVQIPYLKDRLLKIYEILYKATYSQEYYELDAENNLIPSSETDPAKALAKTINLKSFIDIYILQEIACNPDLGHSSFYLSLDMSESGDKLLTLNCPWDFDLALGIARGFAEAPDVVGQWAMQCTLNPGISLLVHTQWFLDLVCQRGQELYDSDFFRKCFILLEDYSKQYKSDFEQNFTEGDIVWQNNNTWNIDNGKKPTLFVRSNYSSVTSEKECKDLLEAWLDVRFQALHSIFEGEGPVNWAQNLIPEPNNYDTIIATRDYDIFEKAPKLVISYDEELYPLSDWYTNVNKDTEKPKIPGSISITNCDEKYQLANAAIEYVKVRGNYTTNYRKKPLKIKFSEKQKLFNLNSGSKAKEGILLADYGDNSMLRNALAFYMGQNLLTTAGSPTFTFVQVYANEEYLGLYLLCDQKETGKNRVNVSEPEKNYTGVDIGYFFERDDYYGPDGEDPGFIIKVRNPNEYLPGRLPSISHETNRYYGVGIPIGSSADGYTIHSKIYSEDQKIFLHNYMCLIYTIMYEACINNTYYELSSTDINDGQNWSLVPSSLTDPKKVLEKVIDLDSFLNMYILQEFVCDPDLAHSSFYFCLDASPEGNKKLVLTCPGDHDRTFGMCDGLKDASLQDFWVRNANRNPGICLLAKTEGFTELVSERWSELYNNRFFKKCLNLLDDYSYTYKDEFIKNYTKYSITGANDSGMADPKSMSSINSEYYTNISNESECKDLLKNWVDTRFKALHAYLGKEESTDWPEPEPKPEPPDPPIPPDPPGPDPEPSGDASIFRKDKLVKHYTEDTGNEMYNNAAAQADFLTRLWNQIYKNPSNAAVMLYNKMYAAVASGKPITDPELQADIRAGNAQAAR